MAKHTIESPIAGSVWTHSTSVGQTVEAGTTLVILECMKMEIPVETPVGGEVTWLRPCGDTINQGDPVATVDDAPKPSQP